MSDSFQEPPHAADLLAIAADTLRAHILPALPPDSRVHALMVLRAIGIASREITTAPAIAANLADRLATLADSPSPLRRLAADIRAGRHDPGSSESETVAVLLADLAAARCAVSNPKVLQHD